MNYDRFFVYLNIDPLPAAWAAYRGTMYSASTVGTEVFRPIAYWPYGLMKRGREGDRLALLRLEKEITLEQIRKLHYPQRVSRLHGIYVWGSEEEAIRCESKWRVSEGKYFDRDNLGEVGFTYSNLTKVDAQWIDEFVLTSGVPADFDWAHSYWNGEPRNSNPHWEILIEGRGLIWGTQVRENALRRIETHWPHLLGQSELSRIAVQIGSDLYNIAPFVFQERSNSIRVEFCLDARDQTDAFMKRIGEYISSLDKTVINYKALELLRSNQTLPDLRPKGF